MSPPARQLALDLAYRPAQGRADFFVSACNEAAVAWLDRWPDWPGAALVIHGPRGAGKSHLASVWQAATGAVDAPGDWRQVAAGVSVVVEDVEARLAAGPTAEEDLLHLYNSVRSDGGSLLFTARAAPSRWPVALPDLASRLRALAAVAIEPPDDALFAALLAKLFHDRQVIVSQDVLTYVLRRIERSFSAVREAVERIDRQALADRATITVPVARRALADMTPGDGGADAD